MTKCLICGYDTDSHGRNDARDCLERASRRVAELEERWDDMDNEEVAPRG